MQKKDSIWSRDFIVVIVVNSLLYLGAFMNTPMVAAYHLELGFSATRSGTIIGTFAFAALLSRFFVGIVSDRMDRRKLFGIAMIIQVLCYVVYGYVTSEALLMLIRIVHGSSMALANTSITAYSTSFVPQDKMGEGMGYIIITTAVVGAVGLSIGMEVPKHISPRMSLLVPAAILVVVGVWSYFLKDEGDRRVIVTEKRRLKLSEIVAPEAMGYAMTIIPVIFAVSSLSTFLSEFGESRGIAGISIFYLVQAVAALIVRILTGKIYDRHGLNAIMIPSLVIMSAGMFIVAKTYSMPLLLVASVFTCFGQAVAQPSLQTACVQRTGVHRSGVASSTFYIGIDIGYMIGPILTGKIIDTKGFGTAYNLMGILLAVVTVALIAGIIFRKKKEQKT